MRLDQYIKDNFDIQSRNKASELIKNNKVKVDNKIVNKPSFKILEDMQIQILEDDFYVSRASYKLKYFLEELNLDINSFQALDIGSSTGGFTQILLKNNVKSVHCVDVGTNQLHERIKKDKRIDFFENTDIRDFKKKTIYDITTCDVSFISILKVINSINYLANNHIIILFKPQFEVGNNVKRDKKGVVKDEKAILNARNRFLDETKLLKWNLIHNSFSKLQGKDGNEEELFYFRKQK